MSPASYLTAPPRVAARSLAPSLRSSRVGLARLGRARGGDLQRNRGDRRPLQARPRQLCGTASASTPRRREHRRARREGRARRGESRARAATPASCRRASRGSAARSRSSPSSRAALGEVDEAVRLDARVSCESRGDRPGHEHDAPPRRRRRGRRRARAPPRDAHHAARRGRRHARPPPPRPDRARAQHALRLPPHGRVARRRAHAAHRDERRARRGERRGVPRRDRVELRLRDAAALRRRGSGADAARARRRRGGHAPRRHRRRLDRARRSTTSRRASRLGSVRFTERHGEKVSALEAAAHALPPPLEPRDAIGVAGTITTLAALDLGSRSTTASASHGHFLTRDGARAQLERLAALPLEERRTVPALDPDRAPVIVAGAAILVAILERTVSTGSGRASGTFSTAPCSPPPSCRSRKKAPRRPARTPAASGLLAQSCPPDETIRHASFVPPWVGGGLGWDQQERRAEHAARPVAPRRVSRRASRPRRGAAARQRATARPRGGRPRRPARARDPAPRGSGTRPRARRPRRA